MYIFPAVSTAAHKVAEGEDDEIEQETPIIGLISKPSICHDDAPVVEGVVENNILPYESLATHNELDGQDIASMVAVPSTLNGLDHAALELIGFDDDSLLDTIKFPAVSPAIQRVTDTQSTAVTLSVKSIGLVQEIFIEFQVEGELVGLVEPKIFPLESVAIHRVVE